MSRSTITSLIGGAACDASQLTQLLTLYRPYLRIEAERSIGIDIRRREDASDILQQTELDVSRSIGEFRGSTEPEFSAWVKQILRRNIITACRNHRAAKRDVRRETSPDHADGSATVSWIAPQDPGSSPSSRLIRGERALRLAAELEKLPANQQLAVRLRHLEGMKIDEVAAALGVTPGAAAGLIRRGVEGLREGLQGESL